MSGFFLFFAISSLAAEDSIDFNRDIRPLLSDKCFHCHGPDEEHRKADLRLDLREEAFGDNDGLVAFVPNNLDASEAWLRIITDDPDEIMPPPKSPKSLTSAEKDLFRRWIEEGAVWTDHWAFVSPRKVAPPASTHPIDHFVQERLRKAGLKPSPSAERRTLLRRLSFDLTGLPPTPEEVATFMKDQSPNAYEKQVDRLLASPHFGERMALMWLDAARYGDTSVMHADGPRDMWPWRDWVVQAYNDNRPFDQFSIWQIAGDLLPNATMQQKLASGFNRNHGTSDEGGAIAEELRVQYVVDRVQTTSNVWLGLSMECAQCHDHKYDPISQKEYFQFYAYFNNTADPGMQTRRGNQKPYIEIVTPAEETDLIRIDQEISAANELTRNEDQKLRKELTSWLANYPGDAEPAKDVASQFKNLKHYFPLDEGSGDLLIEARQRKDAHGSAITPEQRGENQGIKLNGKITYAARSFTEYDFKNQLTLSAWIKIDSPVTGAVFAKMDSKNHFRGYDLWIQGDRPGIHLINKWPQNAVKVVASTGLTPGQWQHVAITYDGKGKPEGIKIYIDGKAVEHAVDGGAKHLTATMKNKVPFRIGGRSESSNFTGSVDDIRIYDRALPPKEIAWTQTNLAQDAQNTIAAKRTGDQKNLLRYNHASIAGDAYRTAQSSLLTKQDERQQLIDGKTTTMVMQDNPPEKMRMTYVLNRGAYDQPKKEETIQPGVPAILPPLPADAAPNRLTLATWLFAEDHPLTARVTVNQIWQLFFGTGIVSTTADFGAQSEFPSHPKLLDWLAVEFKESGWDIKSLIKFIVTSETYQQSSNVRPDDFEKDPENRLLARSLRFRLQAEFIRDNALQLSGLLDPTFGGPGVKPYQPPGLWAEVSLGGNPKFVQDKGQKLYRRSLYTYWKRSSPPPNMQIFDAPTRETCVLKRPRTNTPLQALVTMNDVQFVEAARHLAERTLQESSQSTKERLTSLFETVLSRPPTSTESATLIEVYEQALKGFEEQPENSDLLLQYGDSEKATDLPSTEVAAWTIITNLVLNLDETLTRG